MKLLIVDESAADDIRDAVVWYERQCQGLGVRFDAAIDRCLSRVEALLRAFVHIGHRDVQRATVEDFPYLAFFRETADRVTVVAIYHNRRDIDDLLRRRPGSEG